MNVKQFLTFHKQQWIEFHLFAYRQNGFHIGFLSDVDKYRSHQEKVPLLQGIQKGRLSVIFCVPYNNIHFRRECVYGKNKTALRRKEKRLRY